MASPCKASRSSQFEPDSINATLATIIANQAAHAAEMRSCFAEAKAERVLIKEQVVKTNGRVGALERWKDITKAQAAGISFTVGMAASLVAWAYQAWLAAPR